VMKEIGAAPAQKSASPVADPAKIRSASQPEIARRESLAVMVAAKRRFAIGVLFLLRMNL